MKFPTIKSKKDSLYITLFFLFSIRVRAFSVAGYVGSPVFAPFRMNVRF